MKKLNCTNCKNTKCASRNAKLTSEKISKCFVEKTLFQKIFGK